MKMEKTMYKGLEREYDNQKKYGIGLCDTEAQK